MTTRKYGWVPDVPGIHDPIFTAPALADLPPSVDLRPQMPPPYDQGPLGSCVAQALAGLLQFGHGVERGIPSRLFIYFNARSMQGTVASDCGTTMRTGVKAVEQYGVCEEADWPYDISQWRTRPGRDCYRRAAMHKFARGERVPHDINQIKAALAANRPVAFGFSVYAPFESEAVKASGVLPMPAPTDDFKGGHAVLAVGYEGDHLLIRNSWGPAWGLGGYFKMPFAYAADPKLAADFWAMSFSA
jgi:C1A family cysteine protease